jgi:hypothetical protein
VEARRKVKLIQDPGKLYECVKDLSKTTENLRS